MNKCNGCEYARTDRLGDYCSYDDGCFKSDIEVVSKKRILELENEVKEAYKRGYSDGYCDGCKSGVLE